MPTNPRAFGPTQQQSSFQPGRPLNTSQPRTGLSRLSGGGEFRSATAMEDLPTFRRTGVGRLDAGMGGGVGEGSEGAEGAQAGAGFGGDNPFGFDFDELFAGLFGDEGETAGQGSPLAKLLGQFEREDPQRPDLGNLGEPRPQAWQDARTAIQGLKTAKQGFDVFNPQQKPGTNIPTEGLSGAAAGISGADRLASLLSAAFAPDVLSGAAGFSLSGLQAPAAMTAAELGVTAADLGSAAGAGAASGAGAGAGAGAGSGAASGIASGIGTAAQALPYLAAAYSIADRGANSQYSSGDQAAMAAIELVGAILAPYTGGLSSILAMGGNSFFKPTLTHNQREAMEFSRMGQRFNEHVMPRLRGAQSVEDLAGAFTPEGTWGENTGTIMANGVPITQALEALRGGLQDPGQVTLDWQQGVNEEKRAYLNDVLNNMVRQQLALISAAQAGDPRAISILQQAQGPKGEYADLMRYNTNRPADPSEFVPTDLGDYQRNPIKAPWESDIDYFRQLNPVGVAARQPVEKDWRSGGASNL